MQFTLNEAVALRYRMVPGSTVRWVVRMDVDLTIETDGAPPDSMCAMVTSAIDCETVRLEGQTALVRAYAHRSDFWVKSGTLDEDDVADPMAGFIKAFLLDDLGSVVPLADEAAQGLAPPDDANPGRALLLALFPPYPEESVQSAMQWEVGLHPSWSSTPNIVVSCALARLEATSGAGIQPVVLHGATWDWSVAAEGEGPTAFGSRGSLKFAAETRVDPRDGWAALTNGSAELVTRYENAQGAGRTVTTSMTLVAERE